MRTTRKTVTFRQPFHLKGLDGQQPPGEYVVVTEEEELQTLLSPGWRRVETSMRTPALGQESGFEQVAIIDAEELSAALKQDVLPPA